MHKLSFVLTSLLGLGLAVQGCDGPQDQPATQDDGRGGLPKADLLGSCEDACGGPSEGSCWCDPGCIEFGDCCDDFLELCETSSGCAGPNPAGCVETGCAEGQTCQTDIGACTPSVCACDEATNSWICTQDCGGGTCVDADNSGTSTTGEGTDGTSGSTSGGSDDSSSGDVSECLGDNPAEQCADPDGCIPSVCGCDPAFGIWTCTSDCNGGVAC